MSKNQLILWGGSWTPIQDPLSVENVDSHAKVSYVFLKDALSKYFDIIGIEEFDKISDAKILDNTVGALSTFQAGFTQLKNKKPELFKDVQNKLSGKMFSIVDATTPQKTVEDKLFTVIPPAHNLKSKLHTLISGSKYYHMGWCASPEHCFPEKKDDQFTIFVDHGHYAGTDHTSTIMKSLMNLQKKYKIRIFIQTNEGVIDWPKNKEWKNEQYERQNKVPWIEMMPYYRQADLFCLTHQESAGLSSMEAAMSGAHLIIPKFKNQTFIHSALLKDPVSFSTVPCTQNALTSTIEEHIINGIDKDENHHAVRAQHSWDLAAKRIYNALSQ